MLFPYMQYDIDGTDITYSELYHNENGKEQVKVCFERWNKKRDDFDSMTIYLPTVQVSEIEGYNEKEVAHWKNFVSRMKPYIMEHAKEDGELYADSNWV